MDEIPKPRDLPNKPLSEAIFELRWNLIVVEGKHDQQEDPGLQILFGRLYDDVRTEFPKLIKLPVSQMPEILTPHMVRYQFRPDESGWPLVQLGPGTITFNDTEGYKWERFFPKLKEVTGKLFRFYPTEIFPLTPSVAILRYINAIKFDPAKSEMGVLEFLRRNLHTTIQIDHLLFRDPKTSIAPLNFALNLTFPLDGLPGTGVLLFSTGFKNKEPVIVMEIRIQSTGTEVLANHESLIKWLEEAHSVVDKWFFSLVRGELLATYEASA